MKEQDIIIQILKKYDLTLPLTWMEKRRIARAKRRTLVSILSGESGGGFRFSISVAFYYMMRGLGLDVSPAAGARAAFAAAALAFTVIASGTFVVIQNSTGIIGTRDFAQVSSEAGTVTAGEGSVKRGGAVISAAEGGIIGNGESISSEATSAIVIKLRSGAVIAALHDTSFRVLNEGSGNVLELDGGSIMSGVPAPFGGVYEVRTPDSLVRVTGTKFTVCYNEGKTTVIISEGKVNISHKASGAVCELEPGSGVESSPVMKRRDMTERESMLMKRFSAITAAGGTADSSALKELNSIYDSVKGESSSPKGMTIDDIRAKFGQIDEVVLYSGKRYTGAVISRGAVMKIMTVNGVVNVPSNEVRNIVLK